MSPVGSAAAPAVSFGGEKLYGRLLPIFEPYDEQSGWIGLTLCDAIMAMWQGVDQIVADAPEGIEPFTGEPYVPVAEANLHPQPSFEYGIQNWQGYDATATVTTTQALFGKHSLELTRTAGAPQGSAAMARKPEIPVKGSTFYTVSVYTRAQSTPRSPRILVVFQDSNEKQLSGTSLIAGSENSTAGWTRAVGSAVAPGGAAYARVLVQVPNAFPGETHYVDGLQVTPTPAAVKYVDGDTQNYYWEGEPGNSTTVGAGRFALEHQGWSVIADPATSPPAWLPWTAQLYGVTLTPLASAAAQRKQIQELPPQKRGTLSRMRAAAEAALTGKKEITIEERPEGHAYRIFVHARTSEVPSEEALKNALLSQKPGGIKLELVVSEAPTWLEATKQWVQVGSTVTWGNVKKGEV